uniref:Uncharacterized protein n=1 Tax=Oryza brachyantha TaxID=4533 RepID=J3LX37_ORYBR
MGTAPTGTRSDMNFDPWVTESGAPHMGGEILLSTGERVTRSGCGYPVGSGTGIEFYLFSNRVLVQLLLLHANDNKAFYSSSTGHLFLSNTFCLGPQQALI